MGNYAMHSWQKQLSFAGQVIIDKLNAKAKKSDAAKIEESFFY